MAELSERTKEILEAAGVEDITELKGAEVSMIKNILCVRTVELGYDCPISDISKAAYEIVEVLEAL